MTASFRSGLLLAVTLAVGVALGLAGGGWLQRHQRERLRDLRRPPGFVAHLEDVIAPRDEAQRADVHRLLEATARGNDRVIRTANETLRARMDSLRTQLAPLLDAGQRDRLDRELRGLRSPFGPPGGRPGGRRPPGPPGGGPPDGPPPDRPPPDRPPPPR